MALRANRPRRGSTCAPNVHADSAGRQRVRYVLSLLPLGLVVHLLPGSAGLSLATREAHLFAEESSQLSGGPGSFCVHFSDSENPDTMCCMLQSVRVDNGQQEQAIGETLRHVYLL